MADTADTKDEPGIKCSSALTSNAEERKYYFAYEDRYRKVYEQGVRYWSAFPWELKGDHEDLEELLKLLDSHQPSPTPRSAPGTTGRFRVLEPGCGEALLAVTLLSRGFDYVGVDVAAIALAKAHERIDELLSANHLSPVRSSQLGKAQLLQHDITDLSFLEPQSFDLALDYRLLHMLVVDSDRDLYLDGLSRALKPGALMLLKEQFREDAYEGPVNSFDDYMRLFAPDLTTVEERTAFNGDEELKVKLTQVPARPRSKAGYLRELGRHGFEVLTFDVVEYGYECRMVARLAD